MTKKDVIRLVSEKTKLSQQEAKEVVQKTFESIIEVLVKDGRIELRNFGVFEVKMRQARTARNPRSGEEVWVEEHETVAFKPGKMMVAKVQRDRTKKNAKKKTAAKVATKAAKATKTAKPATKAVKTTAKAVKAPAKAAKKTHAR
ncbi:MAG: HU family DNA-binding protein [Planctomycetia bacterium]|nr:HU family DNA-binding protein [Planctomycetia bacterium]